DPELLGVELDPVPVVARDHAGDRILLRDGLADPHRHLSARAEPGTLRRVVDLDPHRADAERVAGLPGPWELLERGAAEPAGEDLGEGIALPLVAALVEVEEEAPGGPLLVVVVAAGQHHPEPRQVDLARVTLLDRPGQRPL